MFVSSNDFFVKETFNKYYSSAIQVCRLEELEVLLFERRYENADWSLCCSYLPTHTSLVTEHNPIKTFLSSFSAEVFVQPAV